MPSIQGAYNWAATKCNEANIGYSQTYRNQQTVNGITYYDCSSFIWYALLAGGFDVVSAYEATVGTYTGNAFTTSNMDAVLRKLGFLRYNSQTHSWQNGDIMWVPGHCEMVYNGPLHYCMGAHTDQVPLADQVSITEADGSSYWTVYGYHYETSYRWYAKPLYGYLRESDEAISNCIMMYKILHDRGWTLNAVAGLIGNIANESGYNPWRWEGDVITTPSSLSIGYGLLQFTPSNNYINSTNQSRYNTYSPNYAGVNGHPDDGDAQIKFIDDTHSEYYFINGYPLSYTQYISSTLTPEYLAAAWDYNYVRPSSYSDLANRQNDAAWWYNYLYYFDPDTPPTPPVPPRPTSTRKSPFWIYIYPY